MERVARKMASRQHRGTDEGFAARSYIADRKTGESQHVSGTPLDSSFVRRLIAATEPITRLCRLLMESADLASPLGRQCASLRGNPTRSARRCSLSIPGCPGLWRIREGAGGHPGTDAVQAAAERKSRPAANRPEIEDMNRVYLHD